MSELDFLTPRRYERNRIGKRNPIPMHIRAGVFMRDGYRCILCGFYSGGSVKGLHLDHVQPWSSGGHDGSANLRTLCAQCNLSRSNWRIPEDDRQLVPIADGCIDCQPSEDYDGLHEYGTLAYCVRCGFHSYSQMVDSCWMPDKCGCAA